VFGPLFFTNSDPYVATLSAFAAFSIGLIARPIGAIAFGYLGDRVGRKHTLIVTLGLMAVSTISVGLLPTYAQIGLWAPLLLVTLRFLQGLAVGGEWGGAVLLAAEHAPPDRKTFFASFAQLGSPGGQILSNFAFILAGLMDKESFLSWGWRLPFLFSFVLLIVGFVLRRTVHETPEFEKQKIENARKPEGVSPLRGVFVNSFPLFAATTATNLFGVCSFYFYSTFLITYTTQYLHMERSTILNVVLAGAFSQAFVQIVAGRLTEYVSNERRMIQLFYVWSMAVPYLFFWIVSGRNPVAIAFAIFLAQIGAAGAYALIAGYTSKLFPTRIRYTAISSAYQFAGAIGGSLAPIIGTMLAQNYPGEWIPLAMLGTAMAGISLLGVTLIPYVLRRNSPIGDRVLEQPAIAS
jgi:MFS family permease